MAIIAYCGFDYSRTRTFESEPHAQLTRPAVPASVPASGSQLTRPPRPSRPAEAGTNPVLGATLDFNVADAQELVVQVRVRGCRRRRAARGQLAAPAGPGRCPWRLAAPRPISPPLLTQPAPPCPPPLLQVVSPKATGDELIGEARIQLWPTYSAGAEISSAPVISKSGKARGEIRYRTSFVPSAPAAGQVGQVRSWLRCRRLMRKVPACV